MQIPLINFRENPRQPLEKKKTGEFKDGQRYYTSDKGLYSVTSKDALQRLGLTANIQT